MLKCIAFKIVSAAIIIFFVSSCTRIVNPGQGPVLTIQVMEPISNCFVRHQGPGVPTTKIKLQLNMRTEFTTTGTQTRLHDEETYTFDPAINTWPVTFTITTPGKPPYYLQLDIIGLECSECGVSYGDTREPTGQCPAYSFGTNPQTYQGAKPRWSARYLLQDYPTNWSIQFSNNERIPNVPNTCTTECIIQ